jgi:hypothetical protein
MSKTRLFLLFLSSVCGAQAWAAACCGGGFAAPALILGDDQAQFSAAYGYSQVIDDVGSDSLWHKRDTRETSETYKIEGAHIFKDRWQAGVSIPAVRRARAAENSMGLGDISGTLGYEYLPDWDYNPWRPKGLGFFQLTAPTGRSVNETDTIYQLDARGRGFWAVGVGTVLSKIYGKWDVFADFDVHRSFNKKYSNSQFDGSLKPGFGGNLGGGAGYNLAKWRFGGALAWTYEDPIATSGSIESRGSAQRYATANVSATYLLPEEWSATLTYVDQTLFGSPATTSLGRGAMLVAQKRWPR